MMWLVAESPQRRRKCPKGNRTICGVPDGEPSVAVALQRNARVQAHHLLTAPKRNVCNDRQGVPFVARVEQRAPGRKGCAYLWSRATPHGEDTSGDGDIFSKSQRGARPRCPFLMLSLFFPFGLQGKGHRFGGGPSSLFTFMIVCGIR